MNDQIPSSFDIGIPEQFRYGSPQGRRRRTTYKLEFSDPNLAGLDEELAKATNKIEKLDAALIICKPKPGGTKMTVEQAKILNVDESESHEALSVLIAIPDFVIIFKLIRKHTMLIMDEAAVQKNHNSKEVCGWIIEITLEKLSKLGLYERGEIVTYT